MKRDLEHLDLKRAFRPVPGGLPPRADGRRPLRQGGEASETQSLTGPR